jgi:hypothetical protein
MEPRPRRALQIFVLTTLTLALASCGRVSSLLPGSAPAVTTPDLSDAERIALARGRPPPAGCRFTHGFAEAKSAIPDVIGDCTENERTDATSGDTLQRTTRGLLVWRKADGLVAFTDGHRTWVRGPDGLVRVRSNEERFAWEAAPSGPNAPALRVVTPGPPVPTSAPAPATPGPGTPAASTPTIPGAAPTGQATGPPPFRPAGPTKPSSEPPKPLPSAVATVPAKP